VTHINGKKTGTTITSAFDYLNERSNYGFIDYQNIPILDWSATPTETYTNRPEPHYGTIDALSMSANGHVIIGSPETNKAYLYNNNVTLIHTFEGPVNRFGIRCSIDDNGSIIAIASNTHLYIYNGSTYAEIWTQSYGNNPPESPWNMKISKDGSTIIASNSVGSTSFQSWTTTDTWSTVIGPVDYISSTSKRVSAIDLSMDGSVMIASGFTGGNEGFINLFSRGTSRSLNEQVITAVLSDAIIIGQSIALSGDGKKAIVGAPNNNPALSTRAQVYFIDITSGTSMSVSTIATLTGRQGGRYGRSVSMDYNGRYAMVSGSMSEYTPSNADGSALLIDTSSTSVIKEFPKSSRMYHNTPSYRSSFNGYGIHCKLSSQGDVAAVSGGGYAYLFNLLNGMRVFVPPPFGDSHIIYTSLSQASRDSIGSGWTQIKYIPGTSTTWFPGWDNLTGHGGTEFLFTTGDFSRWLICDQSVVNGRNYFNEDRTITKSSISLTGTYTAKWYYRHWHVPDPSVSLEDHDVSVGKNTIMYAENSTIENSASIHSSGMHVFVR